MQALRSTAGGAARRGRRGAVAVAAAVVTPRAGLHTVALGRAPRAFAVGRGARGLAPVAALPRRGFSNAPKPADDQEPTYATGDLAGYEIYHQKTPFNLSTGGVLPELRIAYETWGHLNKAKDNVILLQCGMSASSHACSHANNMMKGWWEDYIGPGKPLDTNLFFVICTNNLGGCYGSTGPSSLDPRSGKRYGSKFPRFEVRDMVAAQFKLLDHLGIGTVHACVGASLGGMQSLCSAALFPERVNKFVSISACAKSFPGSIAFRHAQRSAIMNDPHWNGGDYYESKLPEHGLRLAREVGTITYRSGQEWQERFGQGRFDGARKEPSVGLELEFQIERYLAHQGHKWVNNYDPNSMLWISKAMDGFSMEAPNSHGKPCLKTGLSKAKQPALVIGVQHDVLFPVWQQKEIADMLRKTGNKRVVYYELDSHFGHDSFLLDAVSIGPAVKGHLEQEPFGAKHLWEEVAENAMVILQSVTGMSSIGDTMRSMFRALAQGDSTVEKSRLQSAAKLMFVKDEITPERIDNLFDTHFSGKERISMAEFLSIRDEIRRCHVEVYLP